MFNWTEILFIICISQFSKEKTTPEIIIVFSHSIFYFNLFLFEFWSVACVSSTHSHGSKSNQLKTALELEFYINVQYIRTKTDGLSKWRVFL